MIQTLLRNHVLANITFALVLVVGFISYFQLPRQQDPTINFNWIVVTTVLYMAVAVAAVSLLGSERLGASEAPLGCQSRSRWRPNLDPCGIARAG